MGGLQARAWNELRRDERKGLKRGERCDGRFKTRAGRKTRSVSYCVKVSFLYIL
jgi:hypothetical protein